jgi:hypothetical protein
MDDYHFIRIQDGELVFGNRLGRLDIGSDSSVKELALRRTP